MQKNVEIEQSGSQSTIYSAYLVPIANHISVLHFSLITVRGITSPTLLCCPSVGKHRCARRSHYTTVTGRLKFANFCTSAEIELTVSSLCIMLFVGEKCRDKYLQAGYLSAPIALYSV